MNSNNMSREQISAFADNELADAEIEAIMAGLRQPGGKEDWELYHQIGDVLRTSDMALNMSPRFSARISAALEREPAIIASKQKISESVETKSGCKTQRWAIPGMAAAAAAVAAVAFVATPQLMVAMKGQQPQPATLSAHGVTLASATASRVTPTVLHNPAPQGVVLRDERIDDYLLAHQQFSPSLYSTAQYARSATFANDSSK